MAITSFSYFCQSCWHVTKSPVILNAIVNFCNWNLLFTLLYKKTRHKVQCLGHAYCKRAYASGGKSTTRRCKFIVSDVKACNTSQNCVLSGVILYVCHAVLYKFGVAYRGTRCLFIVNSWRAAVEKITFAWLGTAYSKVGHRIAWTGSTACK